MWDLIVSVPDHCLSFYFSNNSRLCCRFFLNVLNCRRYDAGMTSSVNFLEKFGQ